MDNAWAIPAASQAATTDGVKVTGTVASGPIIGIDLGTTNSCMAIWHPGKNRAKIIKNLHERRLTASTVSFGESFDDAIVGGSALESTHAVVTGTKAFLGIVGDDELPANTSLPPEATRDAAGRVQLTCEDAHGRTASLSPEQISTHILRYLKQSAETYLARKPVRGLPEGYSLDHQMRGSKVDVTRVVIGIPVCFTEAQREATRLAAARAGFCEVHLMMESSAAALAYGLLTAGTKTILVFDIGGGTTDVTIMEVAEGSYSIAATGGQGKCGGERMDALLLELILSKVADQAALGLCERAALLGPRSRLEHGRLLGMARKCKEALTTAESATAQLPIDISALLLSSLSSPSPSSSSASSAAAGGAAGGGGGGGAAAAAAPSRTLASTPTALAALSTVTVTRRELEACIRPLCQLVKEVVAAVVTEYYRTARQPRIDEIILVGGTSHVPVVRKTVRAALTDCGVHWYRETAGVGGGANGNGNGGSNGNGKGGSNGNSSSSNGGSSGSAPGSKHRGASRTDQPPDGEFCCSIDPHEAVAQGLAIRAGILMGVDQGRLKDILMLDVTPKSLGVLVTEGDGAGGERQFFEPVLLKSTRLPARGVCKFRLERADQRFVTVEVYEELDSLVLRESVAKGAASNLATVLAEGGAAYVVKYDYRRMCTYDFPVADFPVLQGGGAIEARFVFVEITMSEEGDTAVRVLRDAADEAEGAGEGGREKEWTRVMMLLAVYLAALGLLYCVVKALLPMHNYPVHVPEAAADAVGAGQDL